MTIQETQRAAGGVKPGSVGEQLQDALALYGETRRYLQAGQAPPDELVQALGGFEAQATAMAYAYGGEEVNPWFDLVTDIRADTERVTRSQMLEQEAYQRDAGRVRDQSQARQTRDSRGRPVNTGGRQAQMDAARAVAAEVPLPLPATKPVHGLHRDGRDIDALTFDPADENGYYIPQALADAPFEDLTDMAIRNAAILQDSPVEVREIDGEQRLVIEDGLGMSWDLTDHMRDLARPEVRTRIRLALSGQVPMANGMLTEAALSMSTANLAMKGVDRIGELMGANSLRNRPTAMPGFKLPWLIPLGEGEGLAYRGDEGELVRDPLFMRALQETMGVMQESGEMDASTLQKFLNTSAGLADFVGFSKGLGLVGKAVAGSSLKGAAKVAEMFNAGRASAVKNWGPFNYGLARTTAEFAAYGGYAKFLDDDTSIGADLAHGALEGMQFSAIHSGVTAARGLAGGALSLMPWIGPSARRLFGQIVPASADAVLTHMRRFGSASPSLTAALEKVNLRPVQRETLLRGLDLAGVGAILGAKANAEADPDFKSATPRQKMNMMVQGLTSGDAVASAAAFFLSSGLQYFGSHRPAIRAQLKTPQGQAILRQYATEMAKPRNIEDVQRSFELVDKWAAAEPELFAGVRKLTPEQSRERQARADTITKFLDVVFGKPPAEEPYTQDLGLLNDARAKFKELEFSAREAATEGARAAAANRFLLGEIPADWLAQVGFGGKSKKGRYSHALNAVHEYLSKFEGSDVKYEKLADVPRVVFERALEWRDRGKAARHGKGQLTLAEAADLAEKTSSEPAYSGMSPIERAVTAKAKAATKRPGLNRSLDLVSKGKRSVEWLKETYPEAASRVGRREDIAQWGDRFTAEARNAWRMRAQKQAYQNLPTLAMRNLGATQSLRQLAARGIEYQAELDGLEASPGVPIVRKRGKAMTLDQFGELAWGEGYFNERPTEREIIDALHDDLQHPASYHAIETLERRRVDEVHQNMLEDYRERFERGEEALPDDPVERRQVLADTFAGDPRYAGMTPERIEREVTELRAQAAAGDPGFMLAGPPPSGNDLVYRAADRTRSLVEELRLSELVDWDVSTRDAETMHFATMLASRNPELQATIASTMKPEQYARLSMRAAQARGAVRDAILARAEESAPSMGREGVEFMRTAREVWEVIDAHDSKSDIPPERVKELQKRGVLDEHGLLNTHVEMMVLKTANDLMWKQVDELAAGGGVTDFSSFIPANAFTGRTWTKLEEAPAWMWTTYNPYLESEVGRKVLALPVFQKMRRLLDVALGPHIGPATKDVKGQRDQWFSMLGRENAKHLMRTLAARNVEVALLEAWGGTRPPLDHLQFASWALDSGFFRRSSGPEALEREKPGTAYLWPVLEKTRDVLEELTTDLVNLGFLNQEQANALGGGAYFTHAHVREQIASEAQQVAEGHWPTQYLGRMLAREGGKVSHEEAIFQDTDLLNVLPRTVKQEAELVRIGNMLRAPMTPTMHRTQAQFAAMDATERSFYDVAARRVVPAKGRTLLQELEATKLEASRAGESARSRILGVQLQMLENSMARPGEKPQPHQMRYSPELDALVKWYLGEGPEGRVYLERGMADELDLLISPMFDLPGNGLAGKAMQAADMGTAWVKKGKVLGRPYQWALQIASNAITNDFLRGNSLSDFLKGTLGLPSYTKTALEHASTLMRFIADGAPKDRPESWTQADWAAAQKAFRAYADASGSSFALESFGREMATNLGGAFDRPEWVRESLTAQMEENAARRKWNPSQVDQIKRAIVRQSNRLLSGLEPIDVALGKMIGKPDALGHARAMGQISTVWHMMDFFMSKYPAYLRARADWPDAKPSAALRYAMRATSDYTSTSPKLRRHLGMRTPLQNDIWKAGTPHAGAKLLMAAPFRMKFWSYNASMLPLLARGAVRYPIKAAAGAATMAALAAFITRLVHQDPEERSRWTEEAGTARNTVLNWHRLSAQEREAFMAWSKDAPMAGPETGPPTDIGDKGRKGLSEVFDRLKNWRDPLSFAAPSVGGESRIGTLRELAPVGQIAGAIEGPRRLFEGATHLGQPGSGRAVVDGLTRMLGLQAQAMFSMFFGGNRSSGLVDALMGKSSLPEAAVRFLTGIGRTMAPALYPTIGLLSREGQFLGEAVFTGGQPFNDFAAGIVRAKDPSLGKRLSGLASNVLWSTRGLYQKPALNTPDDAWNALLSEVYGPGFDPTNEDGVQKRRAGRWASRQLGQLISDLYDQHFDEAADWNAGPVSLDDRVVGALRETLQETERFPLVGTQIRPGYEPKGLLLKAISDLPAEQQGPAIEFVKGWASSERFKQDGINMLFEAGRRREMPKEVFRQALRNAMEDPSGSGLISWWWSEIKGGDLETLGRLSPLNYDVETPHPGSATYETWRKIQAAYARAGVELPLGAADVLKSPTDVLGEQGDARALQGGRAFKNLLHESPLAPSLFGPPR